MSQRREFRKSIRVEIIKRAMASGVLRCEECAVAIKRGEIHHTRADGLEIDKERPLTASDGLLLCVGPGSCHAVHTAMDVPAIAKAKRREAAHSGARVAPVRTIQSAPFPRSERSIRREPKPSLAPRNLFASIV